MSIRKSIWAALVCLWCFKSDSRPHVRPIRGREGRASLFANFCHASIHATDPGRTSRLVPAGCYAVTGTPHASRHPACTARRCTALHSNTRLKCKGPRSRPRPHPRPRSRQSPRPDIAPPMHNLGLSPPHQRRWTFSSVEETFATSHLPIQFLTRPGQTTSLPTTDSDLRSVNLPYHLGRPLHEPTPKVGTYHLSTLELHLCFHSAAENLSDLLTYNRSWGQPLAAA